MAKNKISFYRYKVKWFSPDEDYKEYIEQGITYGETYADACENVIAYYGDDNLGYVHLIGITEPGITCLLKSEIKFNEKI